MPTSVQRRPGRYPVRLSLNVPEPTSDNLDRWQERLRRPRAEIARQALEVGLKVFAERHRKRRRRSGDGAPDGAFAETLAPPVPR